jgi:excinuclease ABC subunit C
MRDASGKIIYIGKAKNLKKRVSSYFRSNADEKTTAIINTLRHIDFVLAVSEREALILERQLISTCQPYFNVMWLDDKSYPYLKLSLKEDYPRLLLTRSVSSNGSEYYGPYPQVSRIKTLLRWLQKVFKWRPCRLEFDAKTLPPVNKVKSCLYFHTDRCYGPCMGKISPEEYRKVVNELRLFLKGNYRKLRVLWEREMRQASENQQYEKAIDLRDRLLAIGSMSEKVTVRELKPEAFNASIKVSRTLEELKDALGLPRWPVAIEGFDISNISGTESVGSMVRFRNAVPDRAGYRKYKIKTVQGVNDTAMIREVVYRRYKRLRDEKLDFPGLILIDGGKGQLSSAVESLLALKVSIPIISLAKRREEVFFADRPGPLKLPANSPALHLLQRIRDEAHRFALAYHHQRRSRNLGLEKAIKFF